MRKVAVVLFWACVGFSQSNEVTFFLNDLPRRTQSSVTFHDGQYQIFYMTNQKPIFWTCPPTVECVNVPQVCR